MRCSYVSTDDDAIASVAEKCGAKVHRRDPATATATATTESALLDFAQSHGDFDVLCLIQATSPFITPRDLINGWELMRAMEADSLVTAVREKPTAVGGLARRDFSSSARLAGACAPFSLASRQGHWAGEGEEL